MKLLPKLMLSVILVFLSAQPLGAKTEVKEAVVKIYTTCIEEDYREPWKTFMQLSMSGSGCILAGHRILTAAHVIANHMFIQVRKSGDTKKYTAEVEVAAHDCDLALFRVNDDSFFCDTQPVDIGELVEPGDEVTAYGFPAGGDRLCTTKGK
jgi:S1-C subfamily serine protease